MESEWELDRMRLYQLRREHPDWTLQQLATLLELGQKVAQTVSRSRYAIPDNVQESVACATQSPKTNCGGSTGGDLRSA